MAFGFPAYHEERMDVPATLTAGDVLAAMAVAGWSGSAAADGSTVECSSGLSALSWSEKIKVRRIGPTTLLVRSECAMPMQWVDWGKNGRNVRKLVAAIGAVRLGVVAMPPSTAASR